MIAEILGLVVDYQFILMVFLGSLTGLLVGAIPGLSVTMTTALLVSITYSWQPKYALAMIMGVYVVGVFSGAISSILINIPGTPASVVTTLDGYPLAKKGKAVLALKYATVYSFVGSIFSFVVLALLAKPLSEVALRFHPMDYFLLVVFGLLTVGSLTSQSLAKGMISITLGLLISMVGLDSVLGIPRLTFGIADLTGGISAVPVFIGLFGLSEVLFAMLSGSAKAELSKVEEDKTDMREILKHFGKSLYYSTIGVLIGALPGAGGPVASFLAYNHAKRIEKNPGAEFGEGAVEGIVASESANNAVIGGALVPLLTLAIPGDAVTAIILSVFYLHGLQPGPLFLKTNAPAFVAIVVAGIVACVFLLVLGLFLAPRISKILTIPKQILLPIVVVVCVVGAFAGNNRMFDVLVMIVFGLIGLFMRKNGYSITAMTLALVLGSTIDINFRRAVSLATSESNKLAALFGRPITLILTAAIVLSLGMTAYSNAKKKRRT